ncbi:hypothetical protein [Methylobacter sp. S3L5C]|uniref:hypothetical protein n=1 Tax=Methylobacter sp. S3L5C TaxID=2839024 RepID=UPI001FADAA73|nr:hypothetical protein [Methylobacter sp. S3L5C]UOA10371.1 hypothetical protein KKZ03_09140 [Methylobacter sp. S3L5C]
MNKRFVITFFSLLMIVAKSSIANQYTLPVQLDYSLIKKALITQIYKGAGNTAELWNDKQGCSYLKLSDPQVSGQTGQIKLLNNLQARFGTGMGGQCVTMFEWSGVLETLQQPTISSAQSVLSLPITKVTATDTNGRSISNNQIQELINRFVKPKLSSVKIDLNESRVDIEKTVTEFLPKENIAEIKELLKSLKFSSADANSTGVAIKLDFNAPAKLVVKKSAAPLTDAEQQQWQASWQEWDKFLSKAIQQASDDTQSPELRDTLMEILLESRSSFQAGLKEHDANGDDPVRVFFTHTWQRLAPQLKMLAKELPEIQGLRYMTFIAATDVIYELENIGAPFGLDISSDGLRKLARILIAGKEQQAEAK